MSNVLTVVFDKAEQKIDSVVAAAVNELHSLGHVVKEVRVMGDSGEVKVALNTIEGILHLDAPGTGATPPAATPPAPTDTVANKNPDGSSGAPTSVVEGVPVDTPPPPPADVTGTPADTELSIDQKRDALLAQLEALDKEEETTLTTTTDPTASGAGGTSTPVWA